MIHPRFYDALGSDFIAVESPSLDEAAAERAFQLTSGTLARARQTGTGPPFQCRTDGTRIYHPRSVAQWIEARALART